MTTERSIGIISRVPCVGTRIAVAQAGGPMAEATDARIKANASQTDLERHAIGLPAVTAQSAALIGPAVGAVAGIAFVTTFAGAATPLAFLIGLVICLCIAVVIGEYAKRLPSAGSFYTYLTQTFGAKTGFVTGVLLFGAYLLLFPFQLDFFGNFVAGLFPSLGSGVWVFFSLALIAVSTTLGILGIKPSLRTGLIGLAFEMSVLTIFSLIIIFQGGAHGNTLQTFNPASSLHGNSGLMTAVVYTIFAFVGFESATTLGDEAINPRKTIPRSVLLTTLVVGVFFVVVSYAVTIGYGTSVSEIKALGAAPAPFNTLADHFGNGVLSAFVNLAVISSFIALDIVTVIALSRVLWKMGKDRLLPSALAKVNRHQSPWVASLVACVFAVVVSVVGGEVWQPLNFASWLSYFATLFFIGAYILISVGLFWFIWKGYRNEFSWWRHGLLPLVSLVSVGWVLWGNIHPYPPAPLYWFIYGTVAAIILSILFAVYQDRKDHERMLFAGQLMADVEAEESNAIEE